MVELGRRWSRICFRGDAAWRVNGLGEAGLSPHGVTQSCTSSRGGIDRIVLAGRGPYLHEEVGPGGGALHHSVHHADESLALAHLQRRKERTIHSALATAVSPHPPVALCRKQGRGSCLGGAPAPCSRPCHLSPCEPFLDQY